MGVITAGSPWCAADAITATGCLRYAPAEVIRTTIVTPNVTIAGSGYGKTSGGGERWTPAPPVVPLAGHARQVVDVAKALSRSRSRAGLGAAGEPPDPAMWTFPDTWLDGDQDIVVGPRTLRAVHTPGHPPGHFVFADQAAGLLFAGDHVLPTITPSIGFAVPPTDQPLGEFMASLAKVRTLPDLRILAANGPVAPSSHTRVDELLVHHELRLGSSLDALVSGSLTAHQVAAQLSWTRHQLAYDDLDVFSRGMAPMDTKAHRDLLVARGQATCAQSPGGVVFSRVG